MWMIFFRKEVGMSTWSSIFCLLLATGGPESGTLRGGDTMVENKISDEDLLGLYWQGLTNREIAWELQVTQAAVYYRLEKLGLANNCHKDQVVDTEQVEILHEMGLTTVGIALLLKTNVQAVTDHLKVLGLEDNYYQLTEIVSIDSITEGDKT